MHSAEKGVTVPVPVLAELSRDWYRGRFFNEWRPSEVGASQVLLRRAGLTGPFWELGCELASRRRDD